MLALGEEGHLGWTETHLLGQTVFAKRRIAWKTYGKTSYLSSDMNGSGTAPEDEDFPQVFEDHSKGYVLGFYAKSQDLNKLPPHVK